MATVTIAGREIGPDHPPFLVAEIGINHNGDLKSALKMIHLAKMSGASAVKFQKRTPLICVPKSEWDKPKETPWGTMDYLEYKERLEFSYEQYQAIDYTAKELDIPWFASVWDHESLEFMESFDPPCHKIGSANMTNWELVKAVTSTGRPLIMSTGMSTDREIMSAVTVMGWGNRVLCHSTSIYPCPKDKLNLRMIPKLKEWFPKLVVGYSGHEQGHHITPAAVALGASYIERHFTLDRRGWGTDQSSSLEYWQFKEMADRCNEIWASLGTGIKEIYPEELEKKSSMVKMV